MGVDDKDDEVQRSIAARLALTSQAGPEWSGSLRERAVEGFPRQLHRRPPRRSRAARRRRPRRPGTGNAVLGPSGRFARVNSMRL